MIRNQRNEEPSRPDSTDDKAAAISRQWSALKESRIVRVSRVFGGKDRHSKVRTIKGLRDRRVRLSVPTAIQLYDLQDRLGLNQPSKVVDWLLNAASHEIDKLPPLQFPPQDLISHLPSTMPLPNDEKYGESTQTTSIEWNADMLLKARERLAMRELCAEKSNAVKDDEEIVNENIGGAHIARFPNSYRFMGLNNSLGFVSSAIPLGHSSYYPGESWNNVHETSSAHLEAAHQSPHTSLLSLAPGSQVVFYPSESSFGVKEAGHYPVDNLDSHSLSLSSLRSFHHSGSQE